MSLMMEFEDRTKKVESDMELAVGLKRDLETYITKWKELEKSGERFLLEIKKGISDIKSLTNKFTSLESEKIRIESEAKVLNQGNKELEKKITDFENDKGVVDLSYDDEDTVTQLMIENKVLEGEKKAAETMAEDLKSKCMRLEMENSALREGNFLLEKNLTFGSGVKTSAGNFVHEKEHRMGVGDSQEEDTPLDNMASYHYTQDEGKPFPFEATSLYGRKVRKQLTFVKEASPQKKIDPSTPGIKRPSNRVIDISDNEDDGEHGTTVIGSSRNDMGDEDCINNFHFASTHKRKRASNIIASDSESNDDNIPIGKLRDKILQKESQEDLCDFDLDNGLKKSPSPRRRLVRKCDKKAPKINSPTKEGVEDDKDETDSSYESESLGGFLVSGSDISEGNDSSSVPEEVSDDGVDFDEVMSKIIRNKNKKTEWEFEADMLADFGKDIELCMKAVCALYRQQTAEEKCSKLTILLNRRGFSQCDAPRGTILAEFLCDGDPNGDVCKSVEELREYNPGGPELCRSLATHYSKQLFAIYKNKEDTLFLPS